MLQSQIKRTTVRMDNPFRRLGSRNSRVSSKPGKSFSHRWSKTHQTFWRQYCIYMIIILVFCSICIAIWILWAMITGSYESLEPKTGAKTKDFVNMLDQIRDKKDSHKLNPNIGPPKIDEIPNPGNNENIIENNQPFGIVIPIPTEPKHNIISSQNRLSSNSQIPSLITPFGEFEVTFRVYKNTNCDENDDKQYITITRGSQTTNEKFANCPSCFSLCDIKYGDDSIISSSTIGSIRIISGYGELDLYEDCNAQRYHGTIYKFDKCQHIYSWPPTRAIKVVGETIKYPQPQPKPYDRLKNDGPQLQSHVIQEKGENPIFDDDCPSYKIVYSCESSEYFGYQTQANYYGFLTSGQHPKATFTRLMTSSKIDDMASYVPTFTTKRHPYSRRYGPLNKADVLEKWYESPHKPTEDVIVVIDPDNWIIRDVSKWVKKVKKGHALGEAAWFHGNRAVTELWKEVCLQNCDWELDLVGVPYFVHRDDLEIIAPWFKKYILIMKDKEEADPGFQQKYKHIQMGWGTEMFGYIFGAAHAGVKHEVVRGVQIRDVSGRPRDKAQERIYSMIHMGRAWFPANYEPGKQWWHTEGKAWNHFGAQVWCKCNFTASDIIPWPMPDGTDFQSRHTLYLLHESRMYFGEIPKMDMRKPGEHSYHTPYP